MAKATGMRAKVRDLVNRLGSTATIYPFSSATKTYNDEGDVTVSNWGGGTSIKIISSDHYALRRLLQSQGEENNTSNRVIFVRDDVTVAHRDKMTIDTDSYCVNEIKKIDPIENTLIAQRCVLVTDENY